MSTPNPEVAASQVELYTYFDPLIEQARSVAGKDWGTIHLGEQNYWQGPYALEIRPKRIGMLNELVRPSFMRVTDVPGNDTTYDVQFGNTDTEDIDVINIGIFRARGFEPHWQKWRPIRSFSTNREQDREAILEITTERIIPITKRAISYEKRKQRQRALRLARIAL